MLIEVTLLGIGVLIWKKLGQGHEWTPEHEEMYQNALEHLKGEAGVAKLREIADSCEENGHHIKAFALRRRADLRATPADVKKKRHAVYVKAMRSTNIEAMLKVAKSFEDITSTKAAADIRKRVAELQAAQDQALPDSPEDRPTEVRVATPPVEVASTEVPAARETSPEPLDDGEGQSEPQAPSRVATGPRAAGAASESSGLQEVHVATRTTPAPPPPSEGVEIEEQGSEGAAVVNGRGPARHSEEEISA